MEDGDYSFLDDIVELPYDDDQGDGKAAAAGDGGEATQWLQPVDVYGCLSGDSSSSTVVALDFCSDFVGEFCELDKLAEQDWQFICMGHDAEYPEKLNRSSGGFSPALPPAPIAPAVASSAAASAQLGISKARSKQRSRAARGKWSRFPGSAARCLHCGTNESPQWRLGPDQGRLCNACGIRYRMGGLLPEYRPKASPTIDMSKHSYLHAKVLELRLQKEVAQQLHPHVIAGGGGSAGSPRSFQSAMLSAQSSAPPSAADDLLIYTPPRT